jgi:sulfide:quinone oxidoreductase
VNVLILGGGTGGLVAASRLRRMLDKEHRVILVDRSPYYTYQPSLTWVMTGQRQLPRITRDLRDLRKKGIEVKSAEITAFDLDNKRVHLTREQIDYDHLIIALGAGYSVDEVPGLGSAWTFYHPDGAEGMSDELPKFSAGRIAIVAPRLPYKCPPSLYEGAFLIDAYFRKRKLRHNIAIDIYTPEPKPLAQYGDEIPDRILELLNQRDITFTGAVQPKSVDTEKHLIDFGSTSPAPYDMLVAAPIHRLPPILDNLGLSATDGFLAAHPDTLATAAPNVYAIGDCNTVPTPQGDPLPKSGVIAHGQAEVVARNLTAEIAGRDPIWAFGGQNACYMETGFSRGATITANHFSDPPQFGMRGPGRLPHWSKIGSERIWLWRWF